MNPHNITTIMKRHKRRRRRQKEGRYPLITSTALLCRNSDSVLPWLSFSGPKRRSTWNSAPDSVKERPALWCAAEKNHQMMRLRKKRRNEKKNHRLLFSGSGCNPEACRWYLWTAWGGAEISLWVRELARVEAIVIAQHQGAWVHWRHGSALELLRGS